MPTGSGKTFTAVRFAVHEVLAKRSPCVVWVAHNNFLLRQAHDEFERQLAEAGMTEEIAIGHAKGDGTGADANLIFAMIQTLARGPAVTKIKRQGVVDLVIFDEFHHLTADTWRPVPAKFQQSGARTLGLSATPFRKSPEKTELLRDTLPYRIYSVGYTELIRDRFLAKPSLTRVTVKGSGPVRLDSKELSYLRQFHQLSATTLDRIAQQAGRDELILKTYEEGRDRFGSTIIFCCSVDHAAAVAQLFSRKGIAAKSICGSSNDPENQENLRAFRNGEFRIATSVLLLTEGVDVPNCRTVFLARPTESPILLSQMMGRAMRGPGAGGGEACNVVDFVDNLEGDFDLAASHFAFVREHDPKIASLIRRPPKPQALGMSMALLLRIREYLNERIFERGGDVRSSDILRTDLAGWLEHWDGEVHRVLLVPHHHSEAILDALTEVTEATISSSGDSKRFESADIARRVYDEHELDADGVSEEDFVAMATARAADAGALTFHPLVGPNALNATDQGRSVALEATRELEADLDSTGTREDFVDALEALRRAIKYGPTSR